MRLFKKLASVILIKFVLFSAPGVYSQQLSELSELLQDEVLEYILEISGTVLDKPFENVRALMTISVSPGGAANPYVVNIFNIGFPRRDDRNVFVWYSDDSQMTYLPGSISCRVRHSYLRVPENIHFFYASPVLYRPPEAFHTQIEAEEAARLADIVLLPTKVTAQAGRLDVFLNGNRVSGRVWIKGYDDIEEAYVEYAASFTGRTFYGMDPKIPVFEPFPLHILEQTDERYR